MEKISLSTHREKEFVSIGGKINEIMKNKNWQDGLLHIYTPHTTSAITINENADHDVPLDIVQHIQKLVPKEANFAHGEGNSDAHILSSLFGASEQVIIENGKMALGTWQGIFFAEFDGPRSRSVYLKFIGQ